MINFLALENQTHKISLAHKVKHHAFTCYIVPSIFDTNVK